MMLIGHSMAQSVHLMHRSSSSRNIPRKRSEGSLFSSGYWTVTFLWKRCRPVTDRPSKRSSSVIRSSQSFSATCCLSCCRGPADAGRHGGETVALGKRPAEPGEQEKDHEEPAEQPGEDDHARRAPRP